MRLWAQLCATNQAELRDAGAPSFLQLEDLTDFRPKACLALMNVNSIPAQKQAAGLNTHNGLKTEASSSWFLLSFSKTSPFLVIFQKQVLSDYCVLVTVSQGIHHLFLWHLFCFLSSVTKLGHKASTGHY